MNLINGDSKSSKSHQITPLALPAQRRGRRPTTNTQVMAVIIDLGGLDYKQSCNITRLERLRGVCATLSSNTFFQDTTQRTPDSPDNEWACVESF